MRAKSWVVVLVLAFGMIMMALSSQAADSEACRSACSEQEEQCYTGCESAKDPEACEQQCTASADACMEACN